MDYSCTETNVSTTVSAQILRASNDLFHEQSWAICVILHFPSSFTHTNLIPTVIAKHSCYSTNTNCNLLSSFIVTPRYIVLANAVLLNWIMIRRESLVVCKARAKWGEILYPKYFLLINQVLTNFLWLYKSPPDLLFSLQDYILMIIHSNYCKHEI